MNFGATSSTTYTSLNARFRSLLGTWVAYIMFTVRTCGGNPFCPLLNPSTIGSKTNAANQPWRMLVGWSLRSKVIGQEDHGLNFGATSSTTYTSLNARFRSLLGTWVAYIMFTVRTCGGNPFCPLLFGSLGSSSSSLCSPLSLFLALNLPSCLNTQQSLLAPPRHRYAAPCLCFWLLTCLPA